MRYITPFEVIKKSVKIAILRGQVVATTSRRGFRRERSSLADSISSTMDTLKDAALRNRSMSGGIRMSIPSPLWLQRRRPALRVAGPHMCDWLNLFELWHLSARGDGLTTGQAGFDHRGFREYIFSCR